MPMHPNQFLLFLLFSILISPREYVSSLRDVSISFHRLIQVLLLYSPSWQYPESNWNLKFRKFSYGSLYYIAKLSSFQYVSRFLNCLPYSIFFTVVPPRFELGLYSLENCRAIRYTTEPFKVVSHRFEL